MRKNLLSRQLGLFEKTAENGRRGTGESCCKGFERRRKHKTEEKVVRKTEETPLLNKFLQGINMKYTRAFIL